MVVYGCMVVWVYGCMDVWVYGCRVYGCMGVWVYGCIGVWDASVGVALAHANLSSEETGARSSSNSQPNSGK